MDLLLAFALAMSVTVALIPLLARFAGRLQVLDAPNPRKVHSTPIPRVGGIAMFSGALVPLLYLLRQDPRLPAFIVAALLLLAVGVWDDRRELSYVPKFLAQIAAAMLVMSFGGVLIHSVMLGERVELPLLVAVPLTLVFLVGVTNAINLADGLDGLAGGTTLLSCCALALLGLTIDEYFVATVSVIVAGSILGFLRFNTYPARIFMGDGGSQFLGFTGAVLSIVLTQSGPAPLSTALPLLIMGLPIIDTLTVMLSRMSEGRSPFEADKNHIHHRLLLLGFEHFEAVFVIYLLQSTLFVAGWYLRYESDLAILLTFAMFAAVVLGALQGASRSGWRWRSGQTRAGATESALDTVRWWQRLRRRLPLVSLAGAGIMASLFVSRTAWLAAPISADIGWLATIFACAMSVTAVPLVAERMPAWWLQAALYVGAVMVVYLDVNAVPPLPTGMELAGLVLLVGSVILSFRLTPQRRFKLTPLDFLVVFVALALPNLPGSAATPRDLGLAAIKLIVLFYGIELLLTHSPRSKLLLQVAGIVTFAVIGARALL